MVSKTALDGKMTTKFCTSSKWSGHPFNQQSRDSQTLLFKLESSLEVENRE